MKLRDIAREAHTSLTTVSLVLNGKPGVSAEKRTRIEQLLRENDYELRSPSDRPDSDRAICFLKYTPPVDTGSENLLTSIMDSAEKECRRRKYGMLVSSFHQLSELEPMTGSTRPGTRGAILMATDLCTEDLRLLQEQWNPLVIVDHTNPYLSGYTVAVDHPSSVHSVVDYLARIGHRHIGFLGSSSPSDSEHERLRAFRGAMELAGLPYESSLVYIMPPTAKETTQAVRELLRAGHRLPSALIGCNDYIAFGAMRACQAEGLSVPEDVSVIGFGGQPLAALTTPPLSTVSVPGAIMGTLAVRFLHGLIQGHSILPSKVLVQTKLLPRGSSGPHDPSRAHPSVLPD